MRYMIRIGQQLGPSVKSMRKSRGLTQKEAAFKAGVLPKTISALENGSTTVTIETLLRLLAIYDYTLELTPKSNDWDIVSQSIW
ncbi:MAG: XRE family transcriptional regulator [Spirochaetae bacterium HGW-Spirochaetae-2]|nr:MAG: XRE family transcriptional regulator [Spirochaetae bacterium HGW-Spirochaetae-2]